MLTELGRRMNEHSENFNKGNIKTDQTRLKNKITAIKNTQEGNNIRFDNIEEL